VTWGNLTVARSTTAASTLVSLDTKFQTRKSSGRIWDMCQQDYGVYVEVRLNGRPAFSYMLSTAAICAIEFSALTHEAGSLPRTLSMNASSW